MDFDNEVSSASVDAADLMQAIVLVVTGSVVSSVAGLAVRWCDCSFLGVESCRTPRGNPRSIVEYAGDGSRSREW